MERGVAMSKKTIMEEVEDAQRDHLKSKLIVIGFDSEKKNQNFKDKLVSQWIEAEGCNKNFRKEK
jgi:ribulose bisphosphate carboxylase small subunit